MVTINSACFSGNTLKNGPTVPTRSATRVQVVQTMGMVQQQHISPPSRNSPSGGLAPQGRLDIIDDGWYMDLKMEYTIYHPYTIHIPSIYHPYSIHIPSIYHPYTIHIWMVYPKKLPVKRKHHDEPVDVEVPYFQTQIVL